MTSSTRILVGLCAAAAVGVAAAHVPYIEVADYSAEQPFVVDDVEQSKALYGWLDRGDVDFFSLPVTGTITIYASTLVPECREYQDFRVVFALLGPGLPAPGRALPFALAAGEGAVIVEDKATARATTYEMFSDRSYYDGPGIEWPATRPGQYRLAVWNEAGRSGDYVAVIGRAERFGAEDFARAARHTATIRDGGELHGACTTG
jgi:hypothetical protein